MISWFSGSVAYGSRSAWFFPRGGLAYPAAAVSADSLRKARPWACLNFSYLEKGVLVLNDSHCTRCTFRKFDPPPSAHTREHVMACAFPRVGVLPVFTHCQDSTSSLYFIESFSVSQPEGLGLISLLHMWAIAFFRRATLLSAYFIYFYLFFWYLSRVKIPESVLEKPVNDTRVNHKHARADSSKPSVTRVKIKHSPTS